MKNNTINDTLKTNVKKILKGINPVHNLWLKILSLVIAVVALYFVTGQLIVEEFEIPLYLSFPERLAPSEPVINTVKVRILASSTILNTLDKNQIYFDFKNLDYSKSKVTINFENHIVSPPGVKIANITPAKIHFQLETKRQKEVSIIVNMRNNLPEKYELLRYELNPDKVLIEGAESIIEDIVNLETDAISLTNRKKTFLMDVPLDLENLNVTILNTEPVNLKCIIVKDPKNITIENIPLEVANRNPEFNYPFHPIKTKVTFRCAGDFTYSINNSDITGFISLPTKAIEHTDKRLPVNYEIKKQIILDNCEISKKDKLKRIEYTVERIKQIKND